MLVSAIMTTNPVTVGPNDTLSAISKRAYGTTRRVPDLLAANPGVDADRLRAGALLYVPKASERPPGTSPTAPRAAVPRVPSR